MTTRKRRRHTPDQIIRKLAEGNKLLAGGQELDEVCQHRIAESTWHRWLAQYGGMKANDAKRLKELESENARLKRLLADAELDKDMLREIASGKLLPNRKRAAAIMLLARFGVSQRRACRTVGIHRSTMRLAPPPISDDEAELCACLAAQVLDGSAPLGLAPCSEDGPPGGLEGQQQACPAVVA